MRVLVCGGRDYDDVAKIDQILCEYYTQAPVVGDIVDFTIISGDAHGADTLARRWAWNRNIPFISFRADWKKYGANAGPIRNKQLLVEGKPDLVIAFPGGKGTADMIRQAKEAGVEIKEVK